MSKFEDLQGQEGRDAVPLPRRQWRDQYSVRKATRRRHRRPRRSRRSRRTPPAAGGRGNRPGGQETGRQRRSQRPSAAKAAAKAGGKDDSQAQGRRQTEGGCERRQPQPAARQPPSRQGNCETVKAAAKPRRLPRSRTRTTAGSPGASSTDRSDRAPSVGRGEHAAGRRLAAAGRGREGQRQPFERAHREIGPGLRLRRVAVETGVFRDDHLGAALAAAARRSPTICGFLRPPPQTIQSFGPVRQMLGRLAGSPRPRRRPACARRRPVPALRRAASVKSLRSSDFGPALAKNGLSR